MLTMAECVEFKSALEGLNGTELARVQNVLLTQDGLEEAEFRQALGIIGRELAAREAEGWDRKLGRFWKRHGNDTLVKGALVGIGAVLGIPMIIFAYGFGLRPAFALLTGKEMVEKKYDCPLCKRENKQTILKENLKGEFPTRCSKCFKKLIIKGNEVVHYR